jgi:sialic acid synthase SpsE
MKLKQLIEEYSRNFSNIKKPYIIAEAGVNHEGSMDNARRLIEEAKEGGADAIKFQTYKAETLVCEDSPSYWDLAKEPISSQYKLFKKYDKFWKKEYTELKKYCDRINIEFFSTPFDMESASFLDDLMDVFKISSSDLNNKPFIDIICSYGKPVILSTGAAYMWEVGESSNWIKSHGNPLALMHCVLNYPTADEDANLAVIPKFVEKFPECIIGYSDHTLPKYMKTLEIAALLGAEILEKHFTYDKSLPGNDHYHAMDKEDLKKLKKRLEDVYKLLGSSDKKPLESEKNSLVNARRSLIAARFIQKGKIIEPADITWKRPANGINPREYDSLLGKKAKEDINEDTIMKWELVSNE